MSKQPVYSLSAQTSEHTIAFLHGQFPCGGAEKVTLDIGEYLHNQGYKVIVLCRDFFPAIMPANSPIIVKTIKHKLKKKSSAFELIKQIQEEKIRILVYMCTQPFYVPFIKEQTGVKIVCANHGIPFWNAVSKNERLKQMKSGSLWQRLRWYMYYYPRCNYFHTYDKKYQNRCRKVLLETDAYTVLCEAYRHEICTTLNLGEADKQKIHVIPNYQQPARNVQLQKEKIVLFVGRLTHFDKRVDRLLEIWSAVEPLCPDWKLLIVGDGEERNRLENMASRLHLNNVSFEGRQTETQYYYQKASILCLTSTFEGWGLVLTEAQTNGVVPIAFNCSAGVECLLSPSGTNGVLIKPFDLACYIKKLLQLMKDEDLRNKIQHHVLQKRYVKEEVCERYLNLYNSLLEM